MQISFTTWQKVLLLLGHLVLFTYGAENENAVSPTTPDYNDDYMDNNYDDYSNRDYPNLDYDDDRQGRSLGHDHHHHDVSNDIPDPMDDENFLRQLRSTIPGIPGVDYPLHRSVPDTGFRCENQRNPGFYGDVEAQCQVFHICQEDNRSDSFLCPLGTVFNQMSFVCDWWFNFRCSDTSTFFHLNANMESSTQSAISMVRDTAARMRRFRSMDQDRIMNLFHPRMRSRNIWKRLRATETTVAASSENATVVTTTPGALSSTESSTALDEDSLSKPVVEWDEPRSNRVVDALGVEEKFGSLEYSMTPAEGDGMGGTSTGAMVWSELDDAVNTEISHSVDEVRDDKASLEHSTTPVVLKEEFSHSPFSGVQLRKVIEDAEERVDRSTKPHDDVGIQFGEVETPHALNTTENVIASDLQVDITSEKAMDKLLSEFYDRNINGTDMFVASHEENSLVENSHKNENHDQNSERDHSFISMSNDNDLIPSQTHSPVHLAERNSTGVGNETHISVSVTIRATAGISRLKWKRIPGYRRKKQSLLKSRPEDDSEDISQMDPIFIKRMISQSKPRSRIMWIPTKNSTLNRKNYWRIFINSMPMLENTTKRSGEGEMMSAGLLKDRVAPIKIQNDIINSNAVEETTIYPQTPLNFESSEMTMEVMDDPNIESFAMQQDNGVTLHDPQSEAVGAASKICEAFCAKLIESLQAANMTNDNMIGSLIIDDYTPHTEAASESVGMFDMKTTKWYSDMVEDQLTEKNDNSLLIQNDQAPHRSTMMEPYSRRRYDDVDYLISRNKESTLKSKLGRRSFLGMSSADDWAVKHDPSPDCNDDRDDSETQVRGWSVIIDSGLVTKEKTVKRRGCQSIFNDSKIIVMQSKLPSYDTKLNNPEENPRNSRITFGSSDQRYWLNLVKNWLESSPDSKNEFSFDSRNRDIMKNDRDMNQELRSAESTGSYQPGRNGADSDKALKWDSSRFFSRTQDQRPFRRFNNEGQRSQRDLEERPANRYPSNRNPRFSFKQDPKLEASYRLQRTDSNRNFQNEKRDSRGSGDSDRDIDSLQSDRKEWHLDMDTDASAMKDQPKFFNTDRTSSANNKKFRPRSGTLDWSSSENVKDDRPSSKGWSPDQAKIDVPIPSSDWSLDRDESKTPKTRQSKWDNDDESNDSWGSQQGGTDKGSPKRPESKPANSPKDWDSEQKKISSSWSGDDESSLPNDSWKDISQSGSNGNPWLSKGDDVSGEDFEVGSSKNDWFKGKSQDDSWSTSKNGDQDQRSKRNNGGGSDSWSSTKSRGKGDRRSNTDWSSSGNDPSSKGDWSSGVGIKKDRSPSSDRKVKDWSNSKGKQPSNDKGSRGKDDWSTSQQKREDWPSSDRRGNKDWSSSDQMKEDWPSSGGSQSADWSGSEQKDDDWWSNRRSNKDRNVPSTDTNRQKTGWSSDDQQQKKDITPGIRQGRKDWSSDEKMDWSSSGNKGSDWRSDGRKKNTDNPSISKGGNKNWRDTAQKGVKSPRTKGDWSSPPNKGSTKTNTKGSGARWPTTQVKTDSQEDISDWPLDDKSKMMDWSSKKPKSDAPGWTDDEWASDPKGDKRDEQSRIPWTQDEESSWASDNNKGSPKEEKKSKGSQGQPDWAYGPSRIPKGFTREKPPSSNPWSAGSKGSKREPPTTSKKGIPAGERRKGSWNPDDSQVREVSQRRFQDDTWDSSPDIAYGPPKAKGPLASDSKRKGSSVDSSSDWSSDDAQSKALPFPSPDANTRRRQPDWAADDAQESFEVPSDWSMGPKSDWGGPKGAGPSIPRSRLSGNDNWSSEPKSDESSWNQGEKGGDPRNRKGGTKTAIGAPGPTGTPPSKPWKDDPPMGNSKGDPGKKEEKIVWSVQISSNGKPGNGWVPITLRPDLKSKRNQTTKGSPMGDEDWPDPTDSWSIKGNQPVTPDPFLVTDTATETIPTSSQFPDASNRHQSFYIPSEHNRYKREARSKPKNIGYRIYRVFKGGKDVDRSEDRHRFYLTGADILVGENSNRVEPKKPFSPPRKEFNETIKNSVPSLTKLRRKLAKGVKPPETTKKENISDVRSGWDNVMQQSEKQESWSEPLDDTNVPASGWIPLFRVKKLPKDFPIPPSLKLYYQGNQSDSSNSREKSMNGSGVVEVETKNFPSTANSPNPAIGKYYLPNLFYENTSAEESNRDANEKNHEQEMKVGNKTLRIIPFSDIMKKLDPQPDDESILPEIESRHSSRSHDSDSTSSEEEWNIPITSSPKTYSLKFVDQSEVQNRNLSSSWTFGNNSKGKDAWILIGKEGEKENTTSSAPLTYPSSRPKQFVERNNTVYKIIVGNRTRHQVGPGSLSSNKRDGSMTNIRTPEQKSPKGDVSIKSQKGEDGQLKETLTETEKPKPKTQNRFVSNQEKASARVNSQRSSENRNYSLKNEDEQGNEENESDEISVDASSAKIQKESDDKTVFSFDLKNWNQDSSWTPLLRGVGSVTAKDSNRHPQR